MTTKYVIYMRHGWSCKCFSDSDLFTNLEFALREKYQIVRVERA